MLVSQGLSLLKINLEKELKSWFTGCKMFLELFIQRKLFKQYRFRSLLVDPDPVNC